MWSGPCRSSAECCCSGVPVVEADATRASPAGIHTAVTRCVRKSLRLGLDVTSGWASVAAGAACTNPLIAFQTASVSEASDCDCGLVSAGEASTSDVTVAQMDAVEAERASRELVGEEEEEEEERFRERR